MKVLIYVNKEKDKKNLWLNNLNSILDSQGVDHEEITSKNLSSSMKADALFVLGGDGTILGLVEFACNNDIPIIGINAGKLGFLTEFEKDQTLQAIQMLKDGVLVKDERSIIRVTYNDKVCYALNDIIVQRAFATETQGMIISVEAFIDNNSVDEIVGDGVIVCTPTGSTAYSLSAGGPILAPGINAFSITPIASHTLGHRPILFSADNVCTISLIGGKKAGFLVDGKLIDYISNGQSIKIEKACKSLVFLRRPTFNYFKALNSKLKDGIKGAF